MAKKLNEEDAMARFAQENETANVDPNNPPIQRLKPGDPILNQARANLQQGVAAHAAQQVSLDEARAQHNKEVSGMTQSMGAGFLPIAVEDLPTKGMFYPQGTKVYIRAANGSEIKHWSMTDETDVQSIDNAINYVLERCMTMSFGDQPASWKDLKEIDRFYILLAIRDFTFTEGNNELKVNINEHKSVVVKKDNIDFIKIPEKLMKHYNAAGRCFTFNSPKLANGSLNVYMPSSGVSKWLKDYLRQKAQRQEQVDEDFAGIAPMLIRDWRGLNNSSYERYIMNCMQFGIYEYSLLAEVRKLLADNIQPKLIYTDEDGAEQTSPLNFRGGLKSIFLLELDDLL